jgi:vitamin B12 transporter
MSKKIQISLAILLIYAWPVLAQDDSSRIKLLDQAVVTATKYPVKLSETGKVLSIISRQQVERSAGKDLSQLLTEQTGILVNGAYSNPGKDKSTYTLGASNDYTLILVDGLPITDPSGIGGALDLRLFPMDQIDHIEILKGSQSTLYGSDAVAGVINIITRNNKDKKINLQGGLSYGTYSTFNGNAYLSGHLKFLDYNVGYSYTSTAGFSEATDTTGKANFDKDGFLRQNVQAKLTFHAGSKLDIAPFYRYAYFDGEYDADAFIDANNRFTYLLNNPGIMASLKLPKGSLIANYSYTYAERNYFSDYGPLIYKGRFNTADIYYNQSFNYGLKLLAGVNYQGYALLDTSLSPKNPATNITSPYASLYFQSKFGLSAEIGGRYNYHSKYGGTFTYSINTSYLIDQRVKLFLDFSTGFKAPTVTQLFGSFGANPLLRPETSVNFQGGIQLSTMDKALDVSAMAFIRNIKDLITYTNNMYTNINEQDDWGAELEANYSPTNKLRIRASWAYVTGEMKLNLGGKDSSFYNLLRKPKNTVNLSAGLQLTKKFFVSASFQWLSERQDIYYQPYAPYGIIPVTLASYGLLNAYAEYKFMSSRFVIFADAKNITDTHFTEVYGYNTIGFTFTGGIRVNL